jgi:2',3'-cyclic-nucleotide 2'-phosphodiesterase (5'-nucleotidase family)
VKELNDPIRYLDIYKMHPFGNVIVEFNMTPEEIKGLIQSSLPRGDRIDLYVSGIEYTATQTAAGKVVNIELKKEDGSLLDESKTYRVGLNNYVASAYTFPHQDPGTSTNKKIADIMIQYLKSGVDAAKYKGLVRARKEVANR